MFKHIVVALKGFLMGAANLVPGVSGGTIAVLTGIYTDLVDCIASLTRKDTWKALFKGRFKSFWAAVHGPFILALALGLVLSIVSLSKLFTYMLENLPVHTWAFFFGLILSSALVMARDIKDWKGSYLIWLIAGVGFGLGVSFIPASEPAATVAGALATPSVAECLYLFLCGAVSICTMILPGVSGSFVLLIMGRYEYVMNAISSLVSMQSVGPCLVILVCFALGALVGILAFARLLHWLLAKWEKPVMVLLLGFITGSLVKVWPWSNDAALRICADGNMHIGAAILCCLLGAVVVLIPELITFLRSRTTCR